MNIRMSGRPFIIATATGALVLGMGGYVYREEYRPKVLEIHIFALKSGRSMFVRTPDDKRYLIDGGANSDIIRELSDILPFYTRRIDGIIATNAEGKNVSGLIDVMNRYEVAKVFVPKFTLESLGIASSSDQIYATFIETIKTKNIPTQEIMTGDQVVLGGVNSRINSVNLSVMFPLSPELFEYSKASAPEVLFRITYGKNSVVFLGSASNKVQKALSQAQNARTDVLLVSHSALPANMSGELVSKLFPKFLVFSKMKDSIKSPKLSSETTPKKKIIPDPFATILADHRFNLKENGSVKIVLEQKGGVVVGYEK